MRVALKAKKNFMNVLGDGKHEFFLCCFPQLLVSRMYGEKQSDSHEVFYFLSLFTFDIYSGRSKLGLNFH